MVQLDDGLATTTTIGPGEGLPLLPTAAAALSFDQVGALPPSPSFLPAALPISTGKRARLLLLGP